MRGRSSLGLSTALLHLRMAERTQKKIQGEFEKMTTPVIITLIIVGGLIALSIIGTIKDTIHKIIECKKIDNIFKGDKK